MYKSNKTNTERNKRRRKITDSDFNKHGLKPLDVIKVLQKYSCSAFDYLFENPDKLNLTEAVVRQ